MKVLVALLLLVLITPVLVRADWQDGGAPQAINEGNGAMISFDGALYFWDYAKGILRSTDNGGSWDDVSAKDNYSNEHVGLMSASDGRIYAGYNNGSGTGMLRYSTDRGVTWIDDTVGAQKHALGWPGFAAVRQIHAWAGHVFVGWDAPDAFDIKAYDGSFVRSSFMGQHDPMAVISYGNTLYVASDKFYYTTDFGATWQTAASNGYVPGTHIYLDGTRLYMLDAGSIDHANNIYYSDDFGDNWTEIDVTALTSRPGTLGRTFATALFAKGKDLWLGTEPKQFYGSRPNVFHSSNGGTTWAADTTGLGVPYYSTVLQLHYHTDGTLWVIPGLGNIYKQKVDGGSVTIVGSPELVTPPNGTVVPGNEITLRWSAVPGAVTYQLLVSTDSSFQTAMLNDSSIATTSRLVTGLTAGTRYYWRVRGLSPGINHPKGGSSPMMLGVWSKAFTFSTAASSSGVTEGFEGPSIVVFPNPATNRITVRWPGGFLHQLALYDLTGRSVASTTAQHSEAATLSVERTVARGAYKMVATSETGETVIRNVEIK